GSGDSVQALKAGIMEIPDVIAINKMDHPAAKTMLKEVRSILSLDRDRGWKPPIVLTEAIRGENIPELWENVEEHRAHLESGGLLEERRRKNLAGEVFAVASGRAKAHLERAVADDPELRRLLDEVQRRELDPLTAVREIMEKVFHLGDATDGTNTRVCRGGAAAPLRHRRRDADLPLGDVLAARGPRGAAEGGELAAHRLVQGARRGQQAVEADAGRARGGRRWRERGQSRPGGRVGGPRARCARDHLRPAGRADGEGR